MPRKDIRFAVGSKGGPHSITWKVFTTAADVYAAAAGSGGIEKISFHQSGICRRAFLSEHPLPVSMQDRVLHRWKRAPTPPAGSGQATKLMTFIFPEGHLSAQLPVSSKATTWLPAPAAGCARIVQLWITGEPTEQVAQLIAPNRQHLFWSRVLDNGDNIVLVSFIQLMNCNDLVMPAPTSSNRDLVLPGRQSGFTPRPVSVQMLPQPDELEAYHYSGWWMPAGRGLLMFPGADILTRNVLQSSADLHGGVPI